MAKQSQIDKAIAQIDSEIAVLEATRARLKAVQTKPTPKRKPKPAAAEQD